MEKSDFLKLKPMLLEETDKPFNDNDYIFEIKFDGIRSLILIDKGKITIKSRHNVILNDIYPELLDIKYISNETCIFDGEIVLIDNGVPSFSKLQERMRLKNKYQITYMKENYPVTFVCFDILYKNKELINLPLIKRKEILNSIYDTKTFIKSKYYENNGIDLFSVIEKNNLEGIIAKRKDSHYIYEKRTKEWLKIKNYFVDDFFICGYKLIKSANTISVILAEKINNKYYFVGKILISHKIPIYKTILKEKSVKNYLQNFNKNIIFIRPKHKLTIQYRERTRNNMLRHAQIKL